MEFHVLFAVAWLLAHHCKVAVLRDIVRLSTQKNVSNGFFHHEFAFFLQDIRMFHVFVY